jgi:hypothetical protein
MKGFVGSFLSISDEKAELTVVKTNGERRVIPYPIDKAREMVAELRAKGFTGEFPRSKRPKVNVRELVASL